ncbi:MAG TPA: DNA cytosine methyltransferase [Candidatus Cloacimonas acidaminovorans]|nr:DNA cytosine methyltransferase [Candidatus Cloacimonas acidaminovorans]
MKKISQKNKIIVNDLFAKPKKKKKPKFTFIDLFAGVGGTRMGFEMVGGECVFTSEWDSSCQKTYQANFGEMPYGDITKIDENEIPDFDILVAGFPCQPFSSIGKRQGFKHATQGTLFYDVLRIIKNKKNKAFLLENVQGLVTHDNGNTFKIIIKSLEEIGYKVFHKILNASEYGVPQQRKRIYIVGFKKDLFKDKKINFSFPGGNKNKVFISDYLEKNVKGYSISEHLQKNYLFKKDDGRPVILDKNSKIQVKTLVSSYHKIQRLTGTFVKDGETGIRLLSENECKAIMGFPKNFIIPVSRTQMYRQMGNSVVVPVIKAIAGEIVKTLEKNKIIKTK